MNHNKGHFCKAWLKQISPYIYYLPLYIFSLILDVLVQTFFLYHKMYNEYMKVILLFKKDK